MKSLTQPRCLFYRTKIFSWKKTHLCGYKFYKKSLRIFSGFWRHSLRLVTVISRTLNVIAKYIVYLYMCRILFMFNDIWHSISWELLSLLMRMWGILYIINTLCAIHKNFRCYPNNALLINRGTWNISPVDKILLQ